MLTRDQYLALIAAAEKTEARFRDAGDDETADRWADHAVALEMQMCGSEDAPAECITQAPSSRLPN